MPVLSKGTLFPATLLTEVINTAKGKSSLAALSQQAPIPFNGVEQFTFSMDSEVDIVAENGAKSHGGVTIEPVKIVPIKFEYGARVSDEFMYASEEARIDMLSAFADGFARKIASGFDQAAMHGINPRTGNASAVVGTNNFDSLVTSTVQYSASAPDANLEAAIAAVEAADGEVSGYAISPAMRAALAAMTKSTGEKMYPDFAFGGQPSSLGAARLSINKTVSKGGVDEAIVGDFANMFRWGYGKQVPMEIIPYGDPDNTGVDLKGHNQVYIRAEVYIGWGILNPDSFARVVD